MAKAITTYVENKDQAQALANFLWNEKMRHLDDIERVDKDLQLLQQNWDVAPLKRRVYVEVLPEAGREDCPYGFKTT